MRSRNGEAMGKSFTQADKSKLAEYKVLIIDDEPEIRALVTEVLADAGIKKIFGASDVRGALDLMANDSEIANLIICDWNMPGMTGVEFLRQIRAVHPDLPFLMITGRADQTSVLEAKVSGVTAFVRKPFTLEQLEEKLKVLVNM